MEGADQQYKILRDKFFEGELHASVTSSQHHTKKKKESNTPEALFHRIEGRLRRIVIKACKNSAPACIIVQSFEDFLVSTFDGDGGGSDATTPCHVEVPSSWDDVLLEKPRVMKTEDSENPSTTVTFLFDGSTSSGGFHRLLVHSVCQFHGLKAITSSIDAKAQGEKQARVLSVTAGNMLGREYRLLDYLAELQKEHEQLVSTTSRTQTSRTVIDLTSGMAKVKVATK